MASIGEEQQPDGYAEEAARRWGDTPEWQGACEVIST